ncbi:OPT oligopeptide transporter protein-domain-containing protein [Suillus clintonianus]|uniref:OPT oligopeptide transporter protein-domain-containing protein n=1 Tax=Suillus clintonianus TaxID=1904413 RepID=UPI001B870988|nr:OPT oligopeptide transporter protein-domain-containing protein [Suillus clintonianus]KAG2135112.1 OPT oligopeptide transporter protein-domain-containing protein [Suillus clintonianus]
MALDETNSLSRLFEQFPDHEKFITHITGATSSFVLPFLYITDRHNPRITALVLDQIYRNNGDYSPTRFAHINAAACFTARLLYDTVLNALAGWEVAWENGCQNWPGEDGKRYNDSIDSFVHGLRNLRNKSWEGKAKGDGRAVSEEPTMVLLIERAERLKDNLLDLIVPLTRLAELSQVRITTILLSSVRWEDIKPPLGASPDPYFIDIDPPSKQDTVDSLLFAFRSTSTAQVCAGTQDRTYHPSLLPLYEQYVEHVYNVCSLYTTDIQELQYIAAARWPGFVKPVLQEQGEANGDGDPDPDGTCNELTLPASDGRMRLLKFFTPSLTVALDALYPRLTNATDWAAANDPDMQASEKAQSQTNTEASIIVDHLPRMSKFILLAAFLASTNPAKSDVRMFGRGADKQKRRRRRSASPKKAGAQTTVAKVSQRLLGPVVFPLDRLVAILGALLEENDVESRPHDPSFELPGEHTDMELGRVHIYAAITELTSMRALHRTTAVEKLEGPPLYKCGISFWVAMALAKDLQFISESAAFPLQRLDSELKNSTDLESEVTGDKQVDDHVQPLSSTSAFTSSINSADFDDPNLDPSHGPEFDDESPYPEVRSAVANTDDPSIHVTTLRTWVLGLAWAIVMPGVNQFFFFRYPSVPITGIVAQLLSFPIGRLCAAYLPRIKILGISLNPGPFTIKEHVLITIMASVGASSAYATDIVAVQRVFYDQKFSFGYQWFLVMSTQLIGFSTGGITRRFLVSPPSMIWPVTLVSCALFNTLHSEQYAGIGQLGGLSRERFFIYVFTSAFVWYFFPGYLFQALSWFSWVTWIWPDDPVVSQLFGYVHGMGMSVITFDWAQIAYNGSPLAMPWWATANVIVGFVVFYWIVTPILYFTNTWYSLYMPISSRTSFDNRQKTYNVTRILTSESTFNETAYKEYSPIFIPTAFLMSYGLSFASITATIVHCFIHFRKQIWHQARRSLGEQADVHARLMSRYPQVPEWWYLTLFALMFALGVLSIEIWPTEMPVWAFIISLMIAFTYVIPCGMIQAITNQQIGLNVITELIIGYSLPGKPVAMMLFKTYGYISMAQALTFTSDFKLGHYMKIPPRKMFWCQIVAAIVAGTTQLGVQSWMFSTIPDICSPTQKDGFTCPNTEVFGTASIIWGVIGPERLFNSGQLYQSLLVFFIIGAVTPVLGWLAMKRYPNSFIRYVNPLIFNGTYKIPPASALNYVPWAIVGFIFQYVIRRRNFAWWTKYNYVLSAALDSGLAVSIIFIYFVLQYPANGAIGESLQHWWGNTVFNTTADGMGTPVRQLQSSETFGPSMGSW